MNLSKYFTLEEFIKSQTATRKGINNVPSDMDIARMKLLCERVIEPIREHFGAPVKILSGYRCQALNNAVGGSKTSQHMNGEAADIEVAGVSNWDVLSYVLNNLEYDQLIQEYMKEGDDHAGWVHVSYRERGNRNKFLIVR